MNNINNKDLLCNTGNYIWYHVITIMEKNLKRYICIYVCIKIVRNGLQIRWCLYLLVPGLVLSVLSDHIQPDTLKPCLPVHSAGMWISSGKNSAPCLVRRGAVLMSCCGGCHVGQGEEPWGCHLPPMGGRSSNKHTLGEAQSFCNRDWTKKKKKKKKKKLLWIGVISRHRQSPLTKDISEKIVQNFFFHLFRATPVA